VYRSNEAFTMSQIAPRGPRTAVGQRADGSILLVTTDGRQPGYSVGMTNFELAQTMVRLGAVQAMALDSGGSTTLAFDGAVLNRPSDGRERAVADALMLTYTGVYVPTPSVAVLSPNGDGVDDSQQLSFKVVRPSSVTITLLAPDGTRLEQTGQYQPGTYPVPFPPEPSPPPPGSPPSPPTTASSLEGRWTFTVAATDDQGLSSAATRSFSVNSTLGFLQLAPKALFLPPSGRSVSIRWDQARPARVKVTLESVDGIPIRTLALGPLGQGPQTVVWNGRQKNGKLAPGGRYLIGVSATNELGTVGLDAPLTVRRIAGSSR
jgi:hypothetical protein